MKKHPEEKLGELYIMSFVIFGAFWPIGVNYGAKTVPPIQFLGWMMLTSSILFLGMTLYHRRWSSLLERRWIAPLSIYSLLITSGYFLVVVCTRFMSAIDTTLLLQSEIIFAAMYGHFFLGERPSTTRTLGILLTALANALTLFQGGLDLNWAHAALFLAPVTYVIANRRARELQFAGLHWAPLLFFRHFWGGLLVLVVGLALEGPSSTVASHWDFILFFGFTIYGLNKIFWQMSVIRMDLSKATALALTHPIFSFILARLMLGETPNVHQALGMIFSILGILFLVRSTSKQWATIDQ